MPFYNDFFEQEALGNFDFSADDIYVLMTTSSYTPDRDAHTSRADITNEVSGTGYTAGGQALASVTVTQDNTGDQLVIDAADTVWSNSTITNARIAVLYQNNGGASSGDRLIGWIDFGSNQSSVAAPFTIQWNAAGILTKGEA